MYVDKYKVYYGSKFVTSGKRTGILVRWHPEWLQVGNCHDVNSKFTEIKTYFSLEVQMNCGILLAPISIGCNYVFLYRYYQSLFVRCTSGGHILRIFWTFQSGSVSRLRSQHRVLWIHCLWMFRQESNIILWRHLASRSCTCRSNGNSKALKTILYKLGT